MSIGSWKYFYQDGELFRLKVEHDDESGDPRSDFDGNVGHMMCWYDRYSLGDYEERKNYDSPVAFLNKLVRENYTDKQLVSYVRSGKTSNNLEIKYNRKDEVYELIGDYTVWWNGNTVHRGVIEDQSDILWLADDIVDALPMRDKIAMLERKGYFFLPLAVYEHGEITMWCGSRQDHFDAQWDCSEVGWIYTTRAEVLEMGGCIKGKCKWIKVTDRNWRQAAQIRLEGEVEMYDMYLQNEVYDYEAEKFNGDDFDAYDSCWGFYSKNRGNELVKELAENIGGIEGDLYDEYDADELIARETERIAKETVACFI